MFIEPVKLGSIPTSGGNLRLKAGSPAIVAGDNSFVTGVLTDLDFPPRVVDGDKDGTRMVAMGAYERQGGVVYLILVYR